MTSFPFRFNNRYLSASSFLSSDKKMIIGVVTDLTQQKKSEDARLEILNRNRALLGAIPDILMEVNNEMIYTWANEAGYDFFGRDVIGKSADFYFDGNQTLYSEIRTNF